MLVGSFNYNNNLGFLFTFLLASMAGVSLVHSHRNFSDVLVDAVQTWPVFEGQPAVFHLQMRAPTSPCIAIRFRIPGGEPAVVDLVAGKKRQVSIRVPTVKRGVVSPEALSIDTRYPFGLFRFQAGYLLKIDCFVYPKPIPVHKLTLQDLLRAHETGGDSHSSIDDFKGLRSYQNGDPTQRIFWKAYSKGQGLLIKEFSGAEAPALFFSWYKLKADHTEKKLSTLCAMILKAHGLKLHYGLILPGGKIAPDRDEHHKHRCLRTLALF